MKRAVYSFLCILAVAVLLGLGLKSAGSGQVITTHTAYRFRVAGVDPSNPNEGDVYENNSTHSPKFYNGTAWTAFGGAAGVTSVSNSDGTLTISPTTGAVVASIALAHVNTWTGIQTFNSGKIQVTNVADPTGSVFATQDSTNDNWFYGQGAGAAITTGIENTAFGGVNLNVLTSGSDNSAFGYGVLNKVTTGFRNVALGNFSLINTTTGNENVSIGFQAMNGAASSAPVQNVAVGNGAGFAVTTGQNNTVVGWHALSTATTGSDNVTIGQQAGLHITTGGQNVLVGELAGATSLTTGTGNVFIGQAAGQNEPGSNKLYISNSNSATPLIKGDFSAGSLTFTVPTGQADVWADAGTNTVVSIFAVRHNTSGTAAAGLGAGYEVDVDSTTTPSRPAGRFYSAWNVAADATRSSFSAIQAVDTAGSLTDVAQFSFVHNGGSPVAQIVAQGTSGQAGFPEFTAAVDTTTGMRIAASNLFFIIGGNDRAQIAGTTMFINEYAVDFVNGDAGIGRDAAGRLAVNTGAAGGAYRDIKVRQYFADATLTALGTTGNQTINKAAGSVRIAAAGTTVTVTDSLVTTSSIILATVSTNDATAVLKNVVPGSGSFVITMNAAVTAETEIRWAVINQ